MLDGRWKMWFDVRCFFRLLPFGKDLARCSQGLGKVKQGVYPCEDLAKNVFTHSLLLVSSSSLSFLHLWTNTFTNSSLSLRCLKEDVRWKMEGLMLDVIWKMEDVNFMLDGRWMF